MEETNLVTGCMKAVLEKYTDPILRGIGSKFKDEWEKFKVDFDLVFIDYLKNSVDKYGYIKTMLYRTQPKYIYDFFVCPDLQCGQNSIIKGDSIDNVLNISNFLIVEGTGGIGKSTFLKHLLMSETSEKRFIPVFVELKNLNSISEDYDITDFIFQRLYDLGSSIKKDYMEYALRSGCFLFLFDGYDEIFTDKKDKFFKKLESFCDRYSNNYFVISSRPYSSFVEFQRFTVLTLLPLDKQKALELVRKVDYDADIKERFLFALEDHLYEEHESFASNPLLLSIMLLTFDNYADIPEKLHLFYANAFETLYSKHDATKAGYRRELRCKLSYDIFKNIFSQFCFLTYYQGKIEFTTDELWTALKKASSNLPSFKPEDFVFDLVNSICVLYQDGLNYKFIHRSFQEYFTAVFLKELSDQNMTKLGNRLIKKDLYRLSRDNVLPMLRDMTEQRFEQNILLPLVVECEESYSDVDKYDFYYLELHPRISYEDLSEEKDACLALLSVPNEINVTKFLFNISSYYEYNTPDSNLKINRASKELLALLEEEKNYGVGAGPLFISPYEQKLYSLLRQTWIGVRIDIMANLRNRLEQKAKKRRWI